MAGEAEAGFAPNGPESAAEAPPPAHADLKPIAVVTVHGTGDTAVDLEGPKWFQRSSAFTEALKARLSAHGFDAVILPHLWSGANSALEREKGADKLADAAKRWGRQYGRLHLIGHSHGGNVVNEAVDHLRWGRVKPKQERIASVTTVGTPFFKLHTGTAEKFAGLLFLWLTIISVAVFTIIALLLLIARAMGEGVDIEAPQAVLWGIGAAIAAGGGFMIRLAIEGYRRITKPNKVANIPHRVLAVWHQNDEAIAFLQKVEQAPIAPFSQGAFLRGSRGAGIVWGVRAVIFWTLFLIALAIGWFFNLRTPEQGVFASLVHDVYSDMEGPGDVFLYFGMWMMLAPLIFVTVYLTYRLFFGVLTELFARKPANRAVEGALKSMAFGRDGDQRLSNIATSSHTLPTREVVLDGEVAQRLQETAAGAATRLIEKYRWALFTVGADTNATLTELSTDAMTWDSLIHTTYFDQPEVAVLIADHIAAEQKALTEAGN